jgi:hypothetical protein
MGGYTQTTIRDANGNIIGYAPVTDTTPYVPGGVVDTSNSQYNQILRAYDQQHYATVGSSPTTYNPQYYVSPNPAAYAPNAQGTYQQVAQVGGQQNLGVTQQYMAAQNIQPKANLTVLQKADPGRSTIPIQDILTTPIITPISNTPPPLPKNPFTSVDNSMISPISPLTPQPQPSMKTMGTLGITLDLFKNPESTLSSAKSESNNTRSLLTNFTKPNFGSGTLQNDYLTNLNNSNIYRNESFRNELPSILTNTVSNSLFNNTDYLSPITYKKKVSEIGGFGKKSKTDPRHHKSNKKTVEHKQISESDILKEMGLSDKSKTKSKTKTIKKKKSEKKPMFWGI